MPIVPTQTLILALMDIVIAEWVIHHVQGQPIRVLLDPVFVEGMQSVQEIQTRALRVIVNAAQIMHAPALLTHAILESVDVAEVFHVLG